MTGLTSKFSKMDPSDWAYPEATPRKSGYLKVQDNPPHTLYWEDYGPLDGEPVMYLHGGPGGACFPSLARLFNPDRYRVILFDQRGCGKSTPNASEIDNAPALTDNTTAHLIEDINKLRDALNITGKMHLFGGSWGSTLALAYSYAHRDNVASMVLRGIFLCRKQDIDYFYQGNAATFHLDPFLAEKAGAYINYPELWADYVSVIPVGKRIDMLKAYADIFAMKPATKDEIDIQNRAAIAWSVWEGTTSYLSQDLNDIGKFSDPHFARAFAQIENHYFMNGAFLGGKSGEAHRNNNYLIDNATLIRDVPVHIVHGRFDVVCPITQANALVRALNASGNNQVYLHTTIAGHSLMERENVRALTAIMDNLPPMPR